MEATRPKVWTLPRGWTTPARRYPLARSGRAAIVRRDYEPGNYPMHRVRGADEVRVTRPLPVTALEIGGRVWMVDDPLHWEVIREFAARARPGRVLCAGLGLGLIVHALRARADVTEVTVVERDADVIDLVAPLACAGDRRVDVVQDDFWDYAATVPRGAYGTWVVDLWTGAGRELWENEIAREVFAVDRAHPWPETLTLWLGVQGMIDRLRDVIGAAEAALARFSPEQRAWLAGGWTMTAPTWTRVPDGEYNEQRATVAGHAVVLYSDRDGERWAYEIDGGDPIDADAADEYGARREAAGEAERWR